MGFSGGKAALPLSGGSGDNLTYSGAVTLGQGVNFAIGSQASPDATLNSIIKANRTISLQQTALGTSTGFTAGSGTGMTSTSTSTGGTGASAYTFGDLVLALKNYNLLAA